MSQIASNKDEFENLRQESAEREAEIDRTSNIKQWQASDATKTLVFERFLGLAAFPLGVVWLCVFLFLAVGLALCLALFRVLAQIVH
jgi:hypothetical protein